MINSGGDSNGNYNGSYNRTNRKLLYTCYRQHCDMISTLPEPAHSALKIFCVAVAWQLLLFSLP